MTVYYSEQGPTPKYIVLSLMCVELARSLSLSFYWVVTYDLGRLVVTGAADHNGGVTKDKAGLNKRELIPYDCADITNQNHSDYHNPPLRLASLD